MKKKIQRHHRKQEVANAKSIAHQHPSYVPIYPSTDTRARPYRNSWDPPWGPGHARREVYLSTCPHREGTNLLRLVQLSIFVTCNYIYNPAFLYITTLPSTSPLPVFLFVSSPLASGPHSSLAPASRFPFRSLARFRVGGLRLPRQWLLRRLCFRGEVR